MVYQSSALYFHLWRTPIAGVENVEESRMGKEEVKVRRTGSVGLYGMFVLDILFAHNRSPFRLDLFQFSSWYVPLTSMTGIFFNHFPSWRSLDSATSSPSSRVPNTAAKTKDGEGSSGVLGSTSSAKTGVASSSCSSSRELGEYMYMGIGVSSSVICKRITYVQSKKIIKQLLILSHKYF